MFTVGIILCALGGAFIGGSIVFALSYLLAKLR